MADWHLSELRQAIEKAGWRFVAERPGDEYRISATWEFERDSSEANVLINFDGLDDLKTLPITESYGCHLQGSRHASLYFGRKGNTRSNRRVTWRTELETFVAAIR